MKTRMKDAREAAKLKQKEAAVLFDVPISTYRNWEQGRSVMNGEQLRHAAQLFDTTVDYLLMIDDEPETEESFRTDELLDSFDQMNEQGQNALLAIANTLVGLFPKE